MTAGPAWERAASTVAAGERGNTAAEFQAELPASLASAREARAAVRRALARWGLDSLAADAALLASELVANAAEHGDGKPIRIALRPERGRDGRPGLVCQVTDSSPVMPRAREAGPERERGRGLAIVAALARTSGVTAGPAGKTAWFTLAAPGGPGARQLAADPELEPEIGG
jgi:anti-sigma regulatory factor (Ser/Thr protein kinase)